MRDILGVSISEGSVHNLHQVAARRAVDINRTQDLSQIRVGLHDEIFHCNEPVLVGVDARSTYCYLLAAAQHRDADTWAIHLFYACDQGFNPDYLIADQGTGLRAGQVIVWEDKPCLGDVFHILQQCESLANVLASVAQGATTKCCDMELKMDATKKDGTGNTLARQLGMARHAQLQASHLAKDVKKLTQWLRRDVLEFAGPCLAIWLELYDFVTAELLGREHLDKKRIRPVRIALQNQRDDLLAFAGALLHGSRCGRGYPKPTVAYATTTEVRTEFGRPALSMRLSTATATPASAHWPRQSRARSLGPIIAL